MALEERCIGPPQPGGPSLFRVPDEIPRLADLARDAPSPPRRAGIDVKPADLSGVIWVDTATERTLTTREAQLQESNKCLLPDLRLDDEDPLALLRSPVESESAHWYTRMVSPEDRCATRSDTPVSLKRSSSGISTLEAKATAFDLLNQEATTDLRAEAKRKRTRCAQSDFSSTEQLDQGHSPVCFKALSSLSRKLFPVEQGVSPGE